MIEGEHFETDVLVIGGGAAGAMAAIKAREAGSEHVLLVEKARTGYSGASCFAAGVLTAFIPGEDDEDLWMKELVEQGQYLNDQDWLQIYLQEVFPRIREVEEWGLPLRKTPDGRYARVRGRGSHPEKGLRNLMFTGQVGVLTEVLRKKVLASGARILDWTMITDLLTKNGRVSGATGFNGRSGGFVAIAAKATVLAAGSGHFRCAPNTGHRMDNYDATLMAYRAGAELINCDFTAHLPFCGEFKMGGMNMTVGLGGRFVNSMGEEFMAAYDPIYKESAPRYILSNAPLMEIKAGRGPLYMDLTHLSQNEVKLFREILPLNSVILERAGVLAGDKITRKLEWSMYGPSLGMFSAGIAVDTECASTLPGLYAAGDAAAKMASGTSDAAGALPFALVSGARAGTYAAAYVRNADAPVIDADQMQESRQYSMNPLLRSDGIEGDFIIEALQEIVIPYEVLMLRHGARMKKALDQVIEVREHLLPLLHAHDPHFLRLAHEARSLVLAAEIALRAGLEREESRANIREDYPYVDNVNWLKRICVKREGSEMRIWAENLPIDRYPVRPKQGRYLHPCLEMAKRRGIVTGVGDRGVAWA
jgi:succinate dehydrogenase/fumarate reductase flavoprotein subunit